MEDTLDPAIFFGQSEGHYFKYLQAVAEDNANYTHEQVEWDYMQHLKAQAQQRPLPMQGRFKLHLNFKPSKNDYLQFYYIKAGPY